MPMNRNELRRVQAPIKERYRQDPSTAIITLRADGQLGEGVTCSVQAGQALVRAGLHPGTGGDGRSAASEDELATLLRLTERYCVVYQTLKSSPALSATIETTTPES